MNTRLIVALLSVLVVAVMPLAAQAAQPAGQAAGQPPSQNVSAGQPNPAEIGKDSAQQLLEEVSVDTFQDAAFWYGAMALDMGVIQVKRLVGSPAGRTPIPGETANNITQQAQYVLGVKVSFFHRGVAEFSIHPQRPIPVEGIVKTLSVWVVGRNFNHVLKVEFNDYRGEAQELTVGTLNFIGWKKLTVAIPPSILQDEYHYSYKSGIQITGFKVETDPLDSYGTYYIYFDDLRAVTDLFGQTKRDSDDMSDGW